MSETMKIMSSRLYLRLLGVDDASAKYCDWLNDQAVNEFLETRHTTIPDLKAYIQKQLDDKNSRFLGVFDQATDEHIGNVKLEPIDWDKETCVLGILIGDKNYWGQGIGTEAVQLAVEYAFTHLGLTTVELGVIADNLRARKTFEKVGFAVISQEKDALNHDGKLFDKIIMRITK